MWFSAGDARVKIASRCGVVQCWQVWCGSVLARVIWISGCRNGLVKPWQVRLGSVLAGVIWISGVERVVWLSGGRSRLVHCGQE